MDTPTANKELAIRWRILAKLRPKGPTKPRKMKPYPALAPWGEKAIEQMISASPRVFKSAGEALVRRPAATPISWTNGKQAAPYREVGLREASVLYNMARKERTE